MRLSLRFAQRLSLRLTAAFCHGFGEVREDYGEPEPESDLEKETERMRLVRQ